MFFKAIPIALVVLAIYFIMTDEQEIKWIPMMPEVTKYQRYGIAAVLVVVALFLNSYSSSMHVMALPMMPVPTAPRLIEGLTGQQQAPIRKRCTINDMLDALDEASEVSSVSSMSSMSSFSQPTASQKDPQMLLQPQEYDEVMSQISAQSSLDPEITNAFRHGTF